MPRGPFRFPVEAPFNGHSASMKDSVDFKEIQPCSISPAYLNAHSVVEPMREGISCLVESKCITCTAVPNGNSGYPKLAGPNERHGVPHHPQNLPSASRSRVGLTILRTPENEEVVGLAAHMGASTGVCTVPEAVSWTPPNEFASTLPSLRMEPLKDKLLISELAAPSDHKRPYLAVSTEKVHTDCEASSSGPPKKNKLGRTKISPAGLQSSCASKHEAQHMSAAETTQPGGRALEKGLETMTAVHGRPGTWMPRGSRPRLFNQGEHVAAKMYFHPTKMAWRSELLVDGCKRQRSFSCKLYGFERARMMCEWSRDFVLRTARLPTDDETRVAVGRLMVSTFPTSNTTEAVPLYTGWLYAYPPFEAGPTCSPVIHIEPTPADMQNTHQENHSPRKLQAQYHPLTWGAGVCAIRQQHHPHPQLEPKASVQAHIQRTSGVQARTGSPCVGEPNADCASAYSLLFPLKTSLSLREAEHATSGEPAGDQLSCEQHQASCADAFAELGVLPVLKAKLKKRKSRKTGKRPHSGVRGMYIYQNAWKVNYFGKHGPIPKFFYYSSGNTLEMKQQHLLARNFLRQVIEKNRQIYDSDGEGLSEEEPVWAERVEKLRKLAETLAAKPLEPDNPSCKALCYRTAISSLTQQQPTMANESSSLLYSGKHSHLEDKSTEGPTILQGGVKQSIRANAPALCTKSVDSKDHQGHLCGDEALVRSTKGKTQPNAVNILRDWPLQTEGGQETLTCKGPYIPQNKQQDREGTFSISRERDAGSPLRRELERALPKVAVCRGTCSLRPTKRCIRQAAFESSPPNGTVALPESLSESVINIRAIPPNSALVFSGDDPEENGPIYSATHDGLCAVSFEGPDKELSTLSNTACLDNTRPSKVLCSNRGIWTACRQRPLPACAWFNLFRSLPSVRSKATCFLPPVQDSK